MTPKQMAFVEEYLVDFNATQAALRAGYSERSAYNLGYRNLRKPEVSLAIEARLRERERVFQPQQVTALAVMAEPTEREEAATGVVPFAAEGTAEARAAEVSRAWVLGHLVELVERCMQAVPVLDRAGRETGEWTFRPREAVSALALLGKHLGMFSTRLDVHLLHEQAEAFAREYDLDADEVLAEAQRWLKGRR